MSSEQTDDKNRLEMVDKLGADFGPFFHALTNSYWHFTTKWQQYSELFAHSELRVDLANRASGYFFGMVQDVMWDDVRMHLARLTDPSDIGGKKNLSIQALPEFCPDLSDELPAAIEAAMVAVHFARVWRNKRGAHHDRLHFLDPGVHPVPPAGLDSVNAAARAIFDVLRIVYRRRLDVPDIMNEVITAPGAVALLYVIADGLEARDARAQRIRDGRPLPSDMKLRREL